MTVIVRDLTTSDLLDIARVHAAAFPSSALTRLGLESVRRYYRWLLEGPHQAARRGAYMHDRLVGFCIAGVFKGATTGFLRKNWGYLALYLLSHPWQMAYGLVRQRVGLGIQLLSRPGRPAPGQDGRAPAPPPALGLLVIAIRPDCQGQGVGQALMADAEDYACSRGYARMALTVHPDNEQAVRFYEKQGWQKILRAGGWAGGMTKDLTIETG